MKQLPNISFSGYRVRIKRGQIYNFSRISKGFAVCFQRLTFFLLSLFFGGVTFLSVNTSGFCRRKATVLSVNTSAFVGNLYGHSLIISKLRMPISKANREIFVVPFLSENYNSLIIKAVEESQLSDKSVDLDFPTKTEVCLPRQFSDKKRKCRMIGALRLKFDLKFSLKILLKIFLPPISWSALCCLGALRLKLYL